jgi:hypothetical protein
METPCFFFTVGTEILNIIQKSSGFLHWRSSLRVVVVVYASFPRSPPVSTSSVARHALLLHPEARTMSGGSDTPWLQLPAASVAAHCIRNSTRVLSLPTVKSAVLLETVHTGVGLAFGQYWDQIPDGRQQHVHCRPHRSEVKHLMTRRPPSFYLPTTIPLVSVSTLSLSLVPIPRVRQFLAYTFDKDGLHWCS